jgi:exonuclease SbcC
LEGEVAGESDFKSQLTESKAERATVEKQIKSSETRFRELQSKQLELDAVSTRVRDTERHISEWRQELQSLKSRRTEQERRVLNAREIVNDRDRILEGLAKLRTASKRLEFLDRSAKEIADLKYREAQVKTEILLAKKELEAEEQGVSRELSEREKRIAAGATVEKEVQNLRTQVRELDELDGKRAALQREVTSQSDDFGALKAQHEQMKAQKKDLEEKLALISEPGAKCPLCRTELGHERHAEVVADYGRQISEASHRIDELRAKGAEAKKRRDEAQQEVERIDAHLRSGLDIRRQLAQSDQVLLAVDESKKQLPELRARLDSAKTRLKKEDFGHDSRSKLKEIASRVTKLEYSEAEHRTVKEQLAGYQQFEILASRLQSAEEGLEADEKGLKSIDELLVIREKSVSDGLKDIDLLGKSMEELPAVTSELKAATAVLATLRDSDRQLTGKIATLEQSIERCKAQRKDLAEKRAKLEKANVDKDAYSVLVAAFGKKGVQALIIENTIPELQDEANRLLARMTDNAMQVSIETVRDKKTGGTAETLGIRISDDMGTRAYECYSGGEAFRVNFALRIALSKLLAQRAGARLQTLIIDEGFGTQDAKGREKLVEAIDSIKDDFEKILVITHIDELKDAFPTRIEVAKDENGSQITVG